MGDRPLGRSASRGSFDPVLAFVLLEQSIAWPTTGQEMGMGGYMRLLCRCRQCWAALAPPGEVPRRRRHGREVRKQEQGQVVSGQYVGAATQNDGGHMGHRIKELAQRRPYALCRAVTLRSSRAGQSCAPVRQDPGSVPVPPSPAQPGTGGCRPAASYNQSRSVSPRKSRAGLTC